MHAYAAHRRGAGKRESSPNAMLLVISAHVALIAAVMSAKIDLPRKIARAPSLIDIRVAPPPEPEHAAAPHRRDLKHVSPRANPRVATIDAPAVAPASLTDGLPVAPASSPGSGDSGNGVQLPSPVVSPLVHRYPRLLTPPSQLKPPYPASKLASQEEATLMLRLTVDEQGHVIAVEPIGRADPAFVDAARQYILARWRFEPASENGRPIAATTEITLRFQLDG